MGKTLTPMEAYRREQKKKELKKYRVERQKDKQAKLGAMDPTELQEQLKALERQVAGNPSDGPTRKRKQELEDTLRAVVKKQKEIQEEERKKQKEAPPPPPLSATELQETNREKFQNPENSIYYHPTLNPFGAPPPGMPQRYRGMPPPRPGPGPGTQPRGPPRQGGHQGHRGPPPPPRRPPSMQQPRVMSRRPGKRPPLPSGPPPPGTIQVPPRPPLPSGAIPLRPPPPPPMRDQASSGMVRPPPPLPQPPRAMMPPPPPYPTATDEMEAEQEMEDSVVAPYPTTDKPTLANMEDQEMDEEAAERAAERQAQLRSLVPVALRVQRQVAAAPSSSVSAPPVPAPRRPVPAPAAPRPGIASLSAPPPPSKPSTAISSVSKEFDAFMEEVKELL